MASTDTEVKEEQKTTQSRNSTQKTSEEKRSIDGLSTSKEKKRTSDRRSTSTKVKEEKRTSPRRKDTTTTDEKRQHERRNTVLEVPVDNRKTDRRKACHTSPLPSEIKIDRRKEQRRNSSIAETVASPVTRFKSGVALDTNKRKKDRRNANEVLELALDHQESDILTPTIGGNRKQERRNASLRGEPPNSTRQRFKSGVPADSDKRTIDRRTESTPDTAVFVRRRATDRRVTQDAPCLSLIPGGKDRRTGEDRRIRANAISFNLSPDTENRKGEDRRKEDIRVDNDKRKGDRREKAKLNRRDSGIASGIDPQNDRRTIVPSENISSERRDSGFASGFRPDLDRRKQEKKTSAELEGVAFGNEENIELLKDSAPSNELFVTGCTFSNDEAELASHPRKNKDKAEVEQRFRTGCQDLPLKDK